MSQTTYTHNASGGGRVVKLLACGARGPGFDSPPRPLNFRDFIPLPSRDMAEIPLNRRNPQYNQQTNQPIELHQSIVLSTEPMNPHQTGHDPADINN